MLQGKESLDLEHVRKHTINQPMDFSTLESYTFDGLATASDGDVEKLRQLPEFLFFNLKRYKSAFEYRITTLYPDYTIDSISKEVTLALQYYAEPHEIPEGLHEIIDERMTDYAKDNKLIATLHDLQKISNKGYEEVVTLLTLILEDMIAALYNLKTPIWNHISCFYEFDSIVDGNVVLKKCVEISRF